MSSNNPTKKQHFVPQFYLKRFADQQNLLQVLDAKNNRLGSPRSYSSVGYEHFFYAEKTGIPDEVSQHVEHWLQRFESIFAQALPRIIDKILNYEQVNDDDRYILAALMCMLWLRSPTMRARLNNMQDDLTKQIMRFYATEGVDRLAGDDGVEMSDEQRAEIVNMLEAGSYELNFSNAQHLKFMMETFGFGGPGFTNMFFGQKWKIYIAKGKKRFITTDSPVVEWSPPPKTLYGTSFLERDKYFALTPEIFIELTYPMGSSKVKREAIFEDRDDLAMLFNILLVAHSEEFAYSGDKALLEYLISGRAKPGAPEKSYYERFELPWVLAKRKEPKFPPSSS